MKSICGCKTKSKNSITLVEGTRIIQEEGELAKILNGFSVTFVKNLGINETLLSTSSSEARHVESIIANFENTPSILTYVIVLMGIVYSPLKKLGTPR